MSINDLSLIFGSKHGVYIISSYGLFLSATLGYLIFRIMQFRHENNDKNT